LLIGDAKHMQNPMPDTIYFAKLGIFIALFAMLTMLLTDGVSHSVMATTTVL
jgi:hypothetical protein